MSRGCNPLRAAKHYPGEDRIFQLPDTCFLYVYDDVHPEDTATRSSAVMGLQWTTRQRIVMTTVDLVGLYKLCRTARKEQYERYAIVHGLPVDSGVVHVPPNDTDRILSDIGRTNEAVQYVFIVRSRAAQSTTAPAVSRPPGKERLADRRVVLLLRDTKAPNVLRMQTLGLIYASVDYADNEAVLPPDPNTSLWQFFTSMRACSDTHTDSACECPAHVPKGPTELTVPKRSDERPLPSVTPHRSSKQFHYDVLVHHAPNAHNPDECEDEEEAEWIVWDSGEDEEEDAPARAPR